jgi:U3 small nucleolar RNA-associated protein 7
MRVPTNGKYAVNNLKFAPFEDILGLGTSAGFSSAVVPGSGVPFYDSFENNPFVTRKQ